MLTRFDWKAEGRFNLATKAAYEQMDLSEKTTVVGSFTSTMTCNDDPWLELYSSGRCQITNRQSSGKPPPFDSDLATTAPDIPFSAALTITERFLLNQRFNAFLSSRQKIKPGSLQMDESTAPMIVHPVQNGYMVYKKSEFIIHPNPKFPGDKILVEFRPIDTGKIEVWELPTTLFKGARSLIISSGRSRDVMKCVPA